MPTTQSMNDIQRLFHRHPWEAVIVGFFLMFALYAIGFAVGYYEGYAMPRPIYMTPIEDLSKYGFMGSFGDEAVRMKPCWSTVSLEGPTP